MHMYTKWRPGTLSFLTLQRKFSGLKNVARVQQHSHQMTKAKKKEELPVLKYKSTQLVDFKLHGWGRTFPELQKAYCMPLKQNMDIVKGGLLYEMYLICNF